MILNSKQVDAYKDDGAIIIRDVFKPWVNNLREGFEKVLKNPGPHARENTSINEKATWSSFSGALAKVAKDRATIPSERGTRYFGPSKMSFKNLLIHSLSIVSVFKINVLIRSILFVLVYLFLIQQKITIVMLIPIILVFVLIVSVFAISKRENLDELNNSLLNISNIDDLK